MAKPVDELKIRHPDSKVKILWSFSAIALAIVLWIFVSFLFKLAFPDSFAGISSGMYDFAFLMLAGLVVLPYLAWVELRYQNYTYYFAETELIIRKGVIRIERIVIPFEKIQNVNISRPLMERLLGLAIIKIETAGTNPGEAEGVIPGVADYKSVVDELLGYVENARSPHPEAKPAEEAGGIAGIMSELAALKEELRRMREEKKAEECEKDRGPPLSGAALMEFEGENYKKGEDPSISPHIKKGKK